uniref:NAD(P)-binding domain-containing protein n=1 Tax=Zea mays TaxID=4577 RepID=A0A804Q0H4_MAIZE
MASSALAHSAARPSAQPTVDSRTRSAFADAPDSVEARRARTAAGTAPWRTISPRATRHNPQMAARQERLVSTAFLSRAPISSTVPTRRTSSDDLVAAAFASPAALTSNSSASLAASILASRPLPPCFTRASDAVEAAASAARPVATRFLFESSMPSEAKIKASTLVAASMPSTPVSSALLQRTDATVSATRSAPGIDSFNSYYDPSLKKARRALLGSHGVFVVEGDINDGRLLAKLFDVVPFTHVLHLAAQAGVRYAMENPAAYVHSNVAGLVSLLEACKDADPQPAVVWASSSFVYSLNDRVPFSGLRGRGHRGRSRGHGAGDPGPPHPPPSPIRHQHRSRRWKVSGAAALMAGSRDRGALMAGSVDCGSRVRRPRCWGSDSQDRR